METVFTCENILFHIWFKSYYVVWKLVNDINTKDTVTRFKSYYVVWKQTGI